MKLVNSTLKVQHEARVAAVKEQHQRVLDELESQAPKPIDAKKHPEGKPPLELENPDGVKVYVMPGDYYSTDENGWNQVISASDVGSNKVWRVG